MGSDEGDAVGETLRKTAKLIGPGQWRRWVLLVGLAITVSGFEMLGAVLVYLLVDLASDPTASVELPVVGDIRRFFPDADDETVLVSLAVVLGVFFLIRAGVRVGAAYVEARVAHNAGARLSNRLVAGYLNLPYVFHLQRNSAELIRNGHQAVQAVVNQVFLPVIYIIAESFLVIGLVAVMLFIAPVASAIAVGVIGLSAVLLLLVIQPRMKGLGRVAHATNLETLGTLQQSLHGIRDVKLLAKERFFSRAYSRSRLAMARALYMQRTLAELPRTILELSLIGFIIIFFATTIVSGTNASASLSVLGLFAYVGLRLQPSIQKIIGGLNSLKFASAPLDDLYDDLSTVDRTPPSGSVEPIAFNDSIVLKDVSFRYDEAHRDALHSVDLVISRGEEIGICGPTGGGKTTLVDIICGLIAPTSGRITVDGKDLQDRTRDWQANLGVVPQAVFLLDDTLRRNIALGVSDNQIDDGALREAVDFAQLRSFVDSLPNGLDTKVGERGVRISGGERQRIAIARALYRRPEVLIFDEGTSALDNTTEAALMGALGHLRDHHTIILVAHRLSTVKESDRVLFVENGSITGEGSYDDLMAHHPSFRVMTGT
jgi:ABC-type multidrug transport system fused ATPase/permease subunit